MALIPRSPTVRTMLIGLGLTTSAVAAPRYQITDLGVAESPYASAVAGLNRSGVAVGTFLNGDVLQCVVLDHGVTVAIATPGGAKCPALGVNEYGAMVGTFTLADGSNDVHGLIAAGGVLTDLGTYAGYPDSIAAGINNQGAVAGYMANAVDSKAFVWHQGRFREVPAAPGTHAAILTAINERGMVTGTVQMPNDHRHAFVHANGVSVDLGTLGGQANGDSAGLAINRLGQVAGYSSGAGFISHAAIFSGNQIIDLGTIPANDPTATSQANDIDWRGWAVGISTDGTGASYAFVYDGRSMLDMNTLLDASTRQQWQLISAQAINGHGQIAGMAISQVDGSKHVFLAQPDQ